MTLRVPSIGGDPVLTVPPRVRDAVVEDFLVEREEWLRAALSRTPQPAGIEDGTVIPVEGTPHVISLAARRGVAQGPGALELPRRAPGPALAAWLKARARDRLAARCDDHAAKLGRTVTRITLRDPRSRWGSCTSEGNLMFSWRLILAPPAVLDYVAAHEVAHLVEMNHSAAFWAVVERLYPGWQVQRDWLRAEGASLHGWRVD